MGSTVTARTTSSVYPATNLGLYTMHRWRSAGRAVVLDGAADCLWIADAAWNSYTGDFHFEWLCKPATIDTGGATTLIIDKWGGAGQRAYRVSQVNASMVVMLSSNKTDTAATVTFTGVFTAATWKRFGLAYDASATELALYINGVESGRATADAGTGTATVTYGSVPNSIGDGTTRLTIGADSSGAYLWGGSLGFIGFDGTTGDHGGYLWAGACDAYYKFDNSDGTDSSGNGRTLTAVSLDTGDYSNCTAYHWVGIAMSSALAPTRLMIDRRHNLSTGATVRVLNGGWFASYASKGYEASVTAGEAIVLTLTTGGSAAQWLEINDPDNTDGYIEIPYIYLGDFISMERAHLRGYDHDEFMPGTRQTNTLGNRAGYISGGQVWAKSLTFRCNATDFSTMQSIRDESDRDRPVVFCEDVDNEDTETWLVQIPTMKYQHIYTTNRFVKVDMQEVAVGL